MATLESYARRLDKLVQDALAIPDKKAPPSVLLQIALILQARDLVWAGFLLSRNKHLTASMLCVRSLAEIIIKMKWLGKSHSRYCCLIIGEEVAELRRLRTDRQQHKLKPAAIKAVSDRISWMLSRLPKRGPYWDRKRQRFREPPSTKLMAEQANARSVYNREFRYSSWHVHSARRIFTHVDTVPSDTRRLIFRIDADKDAEMPPDFALFALYLRAVFILQKCGVAIGEAEFSRIIKDYGTQHGIVKAQ